MSDRVFELSPDKGKIILATNIAEASLTIRNVKYVLDFGVSESTPGSPSSAIRLTKGDEEVGRSRPVHHKTSTPNDLRWLEGRPLRKPDAIP